MTQFADDKPVQSADEPDQELDQRLDWEEELEEKYGVTSRRDQHRESKMIGTGLAKQKELIDKNKGYGASRRPKVNLVDKIGKK
ncbi:MAG TPA: hypothetical protein PKL09_03810 [bacterium]|nr:hypothetical protein [bacterium]HNS34364.1 hypothetical protein [bacterium]HNW09245.1 hypothetical protein [bacterium]HNZ73639.1 hypothetical protein [bacterium]HOH67323.1 hypothetical protein [bacterium]